LTLLGHSRMIVIFVNNCHLQGGQLEVATVSPSHVEQPVRYWTFRAFRTLTDRMPRLSVIQSLEQSVFKEAIALVFFKLAGPNKPKGIFFHGIALEDACIQVYLRCPHTLKTWKSRVSVTEHDPHSGGRLVLWFSSSLGLDGERPRVLLCFRVRPLGGGL